MEYCENLNHPLTDAIIHKTTPDTEMQTKVNYSLKCEIHQGSGDIIIYVRTKRSIGILTSL